MVVDMNYWRKVSKNILVLFLSIIAIVLAFKLAMFYMPFLIAFIISLMIEPLIKYIMKKTKLKRRTSAIIVFIFVIGIIGGLLTWGIASLIAETGNLLSDFNKYADNIYKVMLNIISEFDLSKFKIPANVMNTIQDSAFEFLGTATQWVKNALIDVISFITSIPSIGIYVVITFLSLYFICVDKIYMLDQMEHHLPETWVKRIGVHLRGIVNALGCYLKAQFTLIIISFVISVIGLYIFHFAGWNVPYPLMIALIIAFIDALPIFGSGTVMIPWAIFLSFSGDIKLGIAVFILWAIMSIVRQFLEPKIVSKQIGIHPIFTLIAMYTGFKFIGVFGMLLGPIILIILKNLYGALIDKGVVKSLLER